MREFQLRVDDVDLAVIQLSEKFGVWRVMRAALLSALAQRRYRNDVSALSDRMLEDIGLERPRRIDPLSIGIVRRPF